MGRPIFRCYRVGRVLITLLISLVRLLLFAYDHELSERTPGRDQVQTSNANGTEIRTYEVSNGGP
jgi:hypothetical protein